MDIPSIKEQEKTVPFDIDLSLFSKKELINIIIGAHERNMTFNEYIVYILGTFIEHHKNLLKESNENHDNK